MSEIFAKIKDLRVLQTKSSYSNFPYNKSAIDILQIKNVTGLNKGCYVEILNVTKSYFFLWSNNGLINYGSHFILINLY